jgi:hypothetical protein
VSAVVVILGAGLGVWAAWRGFRRGAFSTFLGWLPTLGAVIVLLSAMRAAWSQPEYFGSICALGGIAATALFVAGTLIVRRRLHSLKEQRLAAPAAKSRDIRRLADQVAGSALGVIHAALICLGIACLGSALSFTVSLRSEAAGREEEADQSHRWAGTFRRACGQVADIANFGVLQHVPGIRKSSRELRALIIILNAPQDKLRRVADKRGLMELRDIPVVRKALDDEEYTDLIADIGKGNLAGLPRLAKSPITRELLECPEIQALAADLKPSQLVADLEAIDDETPQGQIPIPKLQ